MDKSRLSLSCLSHSTPVLKFENMDSNSKSKKIVDKSRLSLSCLSHSTPVLKFENMDSNSKSKKIVDKSRLSLSCLSHSTPVLKFENMDSNSKSKKIEEVRVYTVPDIYAHKRGSNSKSKKKNSDNDNDVCAKNKIMTDGCGLISSDLALKIRKVLSISKRYGINDCFSGDSNSNSNNIVENGHIQTRSRSNITSNTTKNTIKHQHQHQKLKINPQIGAFQVRCVCRRGGFKGMLVVHPGLPTNTLIFRNSMRKFGPPAELLNESEKLKLTSIAGFDTLDVCGQNNPPLECHTLGGSLQDRLHVSETIKSKAVIPTELKNRLVNLFRVYTSGGSAPVAEVAGAAGAAGATVSTLMHIAQPMNRQVILVLSSLGVPNYVFSELLELDYLLTTWICLDPKRCHMWLEAHSVSAECAHATATGARADTWRTDENEQNRKDKVSQVQKTANIVKVMLSHRFSPDEPFIQQLFRDIASTSGVFETPFKTRIALPGSIYLYAVPDPFSGLIPNGKVFIKIHGTTLPTGTHVFVTRSPCMHPSHVVGLEAIDVHELQYLDNIAVFSVLTSSQTSQQQPRKVDRKQNTSSQNTAYCSSYRPPHAHSRKNPTSPLEKMFGESRHFKLFYFHFCSAIDVIMNRLSRQNLFMYIVGGDYDGDLVYCIWNPKIVNPITWNRVHQFSDVDVISNVKTKLKICLLLLLKYIRKRIHLSGRGAECKQNSTGNNHNHKHGNSHSYRYEHKHEHSCKYRYCYSDRYSDSDSYEQTYIQQTKARKVVWAWKGVAEECWFYDEMQKWSIFDGSAKSRSRCWSFENKSRKFCKFIKCIKCYAGK